jgi:PilZ domain
MGYWPEAVEAEARVCPRRRRSPRHGVRSLTYVKLDQENGGIILDMTESGVAIQAVGSLQAGQEVQMRFEVNSPRVRVEARGRVAWADWGGKAGIQFLGVTPRVQRALRDWLLLQMLSAAAASGRDSMFSSREMELTFSAAMREAIMVAAPGPRVEWGLFSWSARGFSIFVDAVVLAGAVLVFAVGASVGMGGVPAWPLMLALMVAAAGIFAGVYRGMFSWAGGGTAGTRWARAYAAGRGERVQRFR